MKARSIELKKIITLMLILGGLSSIAAIIWTSWSYLQLMNRNNIRERMKSNLISYTEETDRAYYSLLRVMEQMSINGVVGNITENYLTQKDQYDQYINKKNLRAQLVGLNNYYPELLIAFYYDVKNHQELVPNYANVPISLDYKGVPILLEAADNIFQAAHDSVFYPDDTIVYSVYRRERFGEGIFLDCYAEMEAVFEFPEQEQKNGYSLIQMDEKGKVCYSTNPVIIRGQYLIREEMPKESWKEFAQEGYQIIAYRSELGYINAVALREGFYRDEIDTWRNQIILIVSMVSFFFVSFVFYLYRLIGKPVNELSRQIEKIGQGSLQDESIPKCGIMEFDRLLDDVSGMKGRIRELIRQSREQEKNYQRVEYEKLLYQINPHFLLNVLNSIQWMARMNDQKEIGEYAGSLKKLLSYNLGKEGSSTTLRTEINMVRNYIFLQQQRYDFEVNFNVEEGDYLNIPVVRMMLQPLVENAIRYGLGDKGLIEISVFEDSKRGFAVITIEDSGYGLSQEKIDQINQSFEYGWDDGKKENTGIGIRYVKAMLNSFYQGAASLSVNSKKNMGTKITILLPEKEGETENDPRIDRR